MEIRKKLKTGTIVKLVILVALAIIPLITDSFYLMSLLVTSGLYALLAMGLNILLGQAGQISLAVGAFYGIGAYTVALLTLKLHTPSILALLAGAIVAGVIAFIVGKPILRLKSYFLALATLGLGTIFTVMCQQTDAVGGNLGMSGIPSFNLFGLKFVTYKTQYYLIWIIVIIVLLFISRALNSRVGRSLKALAVNEIAAGSLGINVPNWKLRTFVLSSFISGLAGGLFSFIFSAVAPLSFSSAITMMVMIMVIIGGTTSIYGSVVGAILITIVNNLLSYYQGYSTGIYALILILLLLFIPGGLASVLKFNIYKKLWDALKGLGKKNNSPEPESAQTEDMVNAQTSVVNREINADWQRRSEERIFASKDKEDLLRIEDLSVFFGGVKAVNEVSISVKEGLITGLIGPNGAGKTTLFNVISGLQKPIKGTVWYKGKEVTNMKDMTMARMGVARTFQNLRIFTNMTVLENVMTGRHRHERAGYITAALGLKRGEEKESREKAMEFLTLVDLAHLADWPVTSLPYGQQRLVEIARALATEPELLLLDEPAAGMNGIEREILVQKIIEIAKTGINILIVEHDIDLIMGLSDKVYVLDFGKLIATGSPQEVQKDKAVIEAYIGVKDKSSWEKLGEEDARDINMKDAEPVLCVDNISTYYGSIGAVRDVSLKVYPGEILTILGSNGAGKTTLLRTISGALKPRSGKITFMGNDITGKPMKTISRQGIGHVPEGRLIFPTLSVIDNLRLGASSHRRSKEEIAKDMEFVFELFPVLDERRKQIAGTLSGGQQQMLAIGRALMGKPKLLLLDEPSMGLAPQVVDQIFETLVKLNREQGLTIVIVEQNAETVLTFAHNAIILHTGEVALDAPAKELAQDERVRNLYLGQEKGA